jgi:hypothetical protein
MVASAKCLSREQRVQEAIKIIGDEAQRPDVEWIMDHVEKLREQWKHTRSRGDRKEFAKQYRAALRKVVTMTQEAPTDFRAWPFVRINAPKLGIADEMFDHSHLLRHLGLLISFCDGYDKLKLDKPRPSAEEKRLASWAALFLFETCSMTPVTTKGSKFCRLAAVLYGDPRADLQHHCRHVFAERNDGSKAFMRVRFSGGKFVYGNRLA